MQTVGRKEWRGSRTSPVRFALGNAEREVPAPGSSGVPWGGSLEADTAIMAG
jgi:hypothetical protein